MCSRGGPVDWVNGRGSVRVWVKVDKVVSIVLRLVPDRAKVQFQATFMRETGRCDGCIRTLRGRARMEGLIEGKVGKVLLVDIKILGQRVISDRDLNFPRGLL